MAIEGRSGRLIAKTYKTTASPNADALALPRELRVDTLRDRAKLILAAFGHQYCASTLPSNLTRNDYRVVSCLRFYS